MAKKEETLNEHEKAVNKVIDYINSHLYDTPSVKELSETANISGFHFHRIFKVIVGENIGEFINRLRLEDIASRLLMTKDSIEYIALDTGYGTKAALSRAFKKHFNTSPSIYRKGSKNIHPFFGEENRPILDLIPEIRTIPQKTIVYKRIIDVYGANEAYMNAWKELGEFATRKKLLYNNTEFIGLSFDDPAITEPTRCRFYASFTISDKIEPEGAFGVRQIPGGRYAVFLHHGAYYKLTDTYFYIYIHWVNNNEWKIKGTMSFEKYLNSPSDTREENLLTEIYIPIKR